MHGTFKKRHGKIKKDGMAVKISITGHQHIPSEAVEYVRRGIDAFLSMYDGMEVVCLSCLAVGADQLFAGKAIEMGFKLVAVIPCNGYETTFSEKDRRRYSDLLAHACETVEVGCPEPTPEAFLKASERMIDKSDVVVALWDGTPGAKGGTGDAVEYARRQGKQVVVIWPSGVKH